MRDARDNNPSLTGPMFQFQSVIENNRSMNGHAKDIAQRYNNNLKNFFWFSSRDRCVFHRVLRGIDNVNRTIHLTLSDYTDTDRFKDVTDEGMSEIFSKIDTDGSVKLTNDTDMNGIDLVYSGQTQKSYKKMLILNTFLRDTCNNGSIIGVIVTDKKHSLAKVIGFYSGVKWDQGGPKEHPYRFYFKRV